MRFIVDEMPHSVNCDCPFAEWKPNPPCFEETGQYVCKNDNKKCDRDVSECRWMIQMPNLLKEETKMMLTVEGVPPHIDGKFYEELRKAGALI